MIVHCEDAEIAAWTDPPAGATVPEHLLSCETCQERLDALRSVADALRHPLAWSSEAVGLDAEREPAQTNWSLDEAGPGALRDTVHLLDSFKDATEREPLEALRISELAVARASELTEEEHGAETTALLLGMAYFRKADSLRFLGRFPAALEALDSAELLLGRTAAADYHLARVGYVRAAVLSHMDRYAEAHALARSSADQFAHFGDVVRQINTMLLECSIHYHQGDMTAARERSEVALTAARRIGNEGLEARAAANVANCDVELGHFDSALDAFTIALSYFRRVGQGAEAARAQASIAKLLLRQRSPDSEQAMRRAAESLDTLGMHGDASIVRLDLAEVLIESGNFEEASALCGELATSFARAGMPASLSATLAHLRTAVGDHEASVALVHELRHNLEDFLIA